jgi:hypothetical protein
MSTLCKMGRQPQIKKVNKNRLEKNNHNLLSLKFFFVILHILM